MKKSMQFLVLAASSALVISLAVTLAAQPASGAVHDSSQLQVAKGVSAKPWWLKDPIEGVWNARVVFTDCASGDPLRTPPPFDAMAVFGGDGSFHDTNSMNPVMQPRSDAFGYWKHVKGRKYKFAFRAFHFDAGGTYVGYNIIRHDVTLAKNGKSYKSEGTAEFLDPDGLPRGPGRGCSKSTAKRFK